jgi:hypothetical protein
VNTHRDLVESIREVAIRVEQFGRPGDAPVNEANTKNWFIEPLLHAMGWDTHDPAAVQAEYRSQGAGQNPVDYALMVDGAPALFLEAKPLGTSLQTPQFVNQVVAYGAVAGVQWVIITDGNEYRIFRTDTAAAAPDKLLASFRITDPSHRDEAQQFLSMLQRDELALDKLTGLWAERDADRRVRAALTPMLGGVDAAFVKYLAKRVPGLRGSDIAASLKRATVTIAFPKAAVGTPTVPPADRVAPLPLPASDRFRRLVAALDADGASWPVTVRRTYKGQDFSASFDRDGAIVVLDQEFQTFSGAAHAAMTSLSGVPKSVTVNGWGFWKYVKRDGTSLSVGDLAPKGE